jgi:hypothetical protein
MEIVLKVSQSPAGHLSGTVRAADRVDEMAFCGVIELLARIEGLCARDTDVTQSANDNGEKEVRS